MCLSDETLKAVGPFYMVSMPGEVKYPTRGELCNLLWTPHSNLEKDNSLNHSCVSPSQCRLDCNSRVCKSGVAPSNNTIRVEKPAQSKQPTSPTTSTSCSASLRTD